MSEDYSDPREGFPMKQKEEKQLPLWIEIPSFIAAGLLAFLVVVLLASVMVYAIVHLWGEI